MAKVKSHGIGLLLRTSTLATVIAGMTGPALAQDYGLIWDGPAPLDETVEVDETLEGDKTGVYARGGSIILTNNGTIRGNGSYDGFEAAPDAGVTIEQLNSSVFNIGSITGAGFGITTAYYFNAATGELEGRSIGTRVSNAAGGSIIGLNNDGIRLIGGGQVINRGVIEGRLGALADGVSIFAFEGQDLPAGVRAIGAVDNFGGGQIVGNRFGVILSGGGFVHQESDGTHIQTSVISGGTGGVLIQSNGSETDQIASVNNFRNSLISGGEGLIFAGSLSEGIVRNWGGTIVGTSGAGIVNRSAATMTIDNRVYFTVGTVIGATSGILAAEGPVVVTNDGVIRGNGSFDGFGAIPDGGMSIGVGGSSITNSGSITGARFGITTYNYYNAQTGLLEPRAVGTVVNNLTGGTVIGDSDDGVRLIGGGTVTNAGQIEGRAGIGADGVSMFALNGQNTIGQTGIGTVINQTGGSIFGNRFGIALSGGGVINNAGSIVASDLSGGSLDGFGGGVLFQAGPTESGKIGALTNSGSISGGNGVIYGANLASGLLSNSGNITGTQANGVNNTGANPVTIDNQAGGSITGALKGIHAAEGAVIVNNSGIIRGNGTFDGFGATPDGGISIAVAGSDITSSGSISGARFGITTYNYYNAQTGLLEPRAIGTIVTNLAGGQIIGDSDDGVRLIGGGTVTNSGLIEGRVGDFADGVSMFALIGQDTSNQTGIGTVINQAGGTIKGNRFGVILSGGGQIDNAGSILGADVNASTFTGFGTGILIQGGPATESKTAVITNSGSISGGSGVTFGVDVTQGTITNSGTVSGTRYAGIENASRGLANIHNLAGGTIYGNFWGILGRNGAVNIDNAGTISNGGGQGAIQIEQAGSTITNSGLIEGRNFGITANPWFNTATGQNEARAANTLVNNSGTIRGINNDGIRLQGGGTVNNSGLIEGLNNPASDGISMFAINGQDLSGITSIGTVNNLATGSIRGHRFGIILSTGGTVNNAGSIWAPDTSEQGGGGFGYGIVIQDGLNAGNKIGTITNTGTISGGVGASFAGFMASANLINEAAIIGRLGDGINSISDAPLTIENRISGSITGARSGVYSEISPLLLTNVGDIRGNGLNIGFNRTDAGVVIAAAGSSVVNQGTISGGAFGITTAFQVDGTGTVRGRAIDTIISNSGTIRGDTNDGVRLIGGGTVNNSGLIEGLNSSVSDGVAMFRYDDQDVSQRSSIGSVYNLAGGIISGNRFGVILSGGGLIENAGIIRGNANGVLIQAADTPAAFTGTLINSGTIENGVRFINGLVANVNNSGTISIDSPDAGALESLAQISVVNTGTISSTGSHAIRFGSFDDRLTLGLGSQIIGLSDAGAGIDTLALDSGIGTEQSLGSFQDFVNFENLEVISGTWAADGDSSAFTTISMLGGNLRFSGPLNPNATIDLGGGTLDLSGGVDSIIAGLSGDASSSLLLGSTNLTVRQEGDTTYAGALSGTGSLIKQGDGRLNLTGINTYTGPTIVSGGTLAVNGSITSPVTIQSGATLGGTGTTGTVTIEAGGVFAPGNSIGTINVSGTLRFADGSSYLVEANAAGQSDRINVRGRAVIGKNVVVNVAAATGNYRPSTEYVILNATDKITGQFAGVTSDLAFLQPKLSHSSKKVELTLKRANVSFASAATNTNQANVASVIDAMGQGSSLHDAVLVQNLAGARTAFSSLSGTVFGSLSNELVSSASRLQSALLPQASDPNNGFASWSAIVANSRSASAPDMRSGISLSGNGLRIAMVAGWLPEDRITAGNMVDAKIESHYTGTILGYSAGGLNAHAGAGFSWHSIEAQRSVAFPSFAEGIQANYKGSSRQLFAELGYDAKFGMVNLAPYAGFSNTRVAGLDIREFGGNSALTIDLKARNIDTLSFGLRGSAKMPLGRSTLLSTQFNIAWQQAWGDLAAFQQNRFGGTGSTFAVTGYQLANSGFDVDAGLKLVHGPVEINAGYRRNAVFQRFDDGAEVSLKLRF